LARYGRDPPAPPKKGHSPQFLAHVSRHQTAGWFKMTLGTEVVLIPGNIVLDGDPAPPKKGHSPHFLTYVYCGQTAGWIKMPLGTVVDLGPGHIVIDGSLAPWALVVQLTAQCRREHWRHVANTIKLVHIRTTWRIWLNMYFLQPTGVHNPNGKSISSADCRVSLYLTMGCSFASSKLPLPMGGHGLHLTRGSLGPAESSTQTASWSVQPFLQGSIVWQTDQQSNYATRSVTMGRIYIHIHKYAYAM